VFVSPALVFRIVGKVAAPSPHNKAPDAPRGRGKNSLLDDDWGDDNHNHNNGDLEATKVGVYYEHAGSV
jgi:hypothetical protein